MRRAAWGALAGALACLLLLATLLAPASSPPPQGQCAATGPAPGQAVGRWDAAQAGNAAEVVRVGATMGVGQRGWVVALATAMQESDLYVHANDGTDPRNHPADRAVVLESLSLPHQRVGRDHNSVGLFQQRPTLNGEPLWGTVRELMDPATSARRFYERLLEVPGWEQLPATVAAQRVQRSAAPDAYAQWEDDAAALATQVSGQQVAAGQCSPLGSTPPQPDAAGNWPPEACSVRPDPSNGRGCLTPRAAALLGQLRALPHASISCWDEHAWNPDSEHPRGRACDVMVNEGGRFPTPAERAMGDAVAAWATANARTWAVQNVIWYGRVWSVQRGTWRPYTGGGVYSPTDPTGGHYDHPHIDVF